MPEGRGKQRRRKEWRGAGEGSQQVERQTGLDLIWGGKGEKRALSSKPL